MVTSKSLNNGFTIVEILVVIVVIGVLAGIVIVSYNGLATRATNVRIQGDLKQLEKAIKLAQSLSGKSLTQITGSVSTSYYCSSKPNGTDFATLNKTTDNCWLAYADSMQKISDASGMGIKSLTDPWGRPYFIDENEGESGPTYCYKDVIGSLPRPFVTNQWSPANAVELSFVTSSCQ